MHFPTFTITSSEIEIIGNETMTMVPKSTSWDEQSIEVKKCAFFELSSKRILIEFNQQEGMITLYGDKCTLVIEIWAKSEEKIKLIKEIKRTIKVQTDFEVKVCYF